MRLPPSLLLPDAETLLNDMRAMVSHDGPVCIDGRDADRISTACIQVLAAAALTVRQSGRTFSVIAPSPALRRAVQDLGLSATFTFEA
jgi:anti-anti-sigma regulatory factor